VWTIILECTWSELGLYYSSLQCLCWQSVRCDVGSDADAGRFTIMTYFNAFTVAGSTSSGPLASTPPAMPGTHPQYFGRGDVNGHIPTTLLHTFGYSRPILVALRSLSLKPISFGYKTPPIRFSPLPHPPHSVVSPPQPWTRVDATVQVSSVHAMWTELYAISAFVSVSL